MLVRLAALLLSVIASIGMAAAGEQVRIGFLKFGTVAWEVDTMLHHDFDGAAGVMVEPVALASNEASKIALQAGAIDIIVTDWPWVARRRAEGERLVFAPYSAAVGSLMIPKNSRARELNDLKGKRIGVAGGPLDKSWILLRALWRKEFSSDLAKDVEPVFGAPPLLSEQLSRGRIDALLTYWHYAARLEAEGATPLLGVAEIMRRLGVEQAPPILGFAFHEDWATDHPRAIGGFLEASRRAKELLTDSDSEWVRLARLIGTEDPKILAALRDGYRSGVPRQGTGAEGAAELYAILVELGGPELVGPATSLDPGIFWRPDQP